MCMYICVNAYVRCTNWSAHKLIDNLTGNRGVFRNVALMARTAGNIIVGRNQPRNTDGTVIKGRPLIAQFVLIKNRPCLRYNEIRIIRDDARRYRNFVSENAT